MRTRAPLAPMGWPRATAPPLTLTLAGSSSSSRTTATAWTANASFSSTRSTLDGPQPVFFQSFRTASTGVIITSDGSRPATAWATIRAIGFTPERFARSAEVTTSAAAPSFTPGALPAVTVPPSLKAGLSFASASSDVSSRGPSSTAKATASPFFWGMGTGRISSLNLPGLDRGDRLPVARERVLVLLPPRDPVLLGHDLARAAHVVVLVGVPQAVEDHRVHDLAVAEAQPLAHAREEVGAVRHRLHAPGHDHVRLLRGDGLGGEHHRLQARSRRPC